MWTGWTTLCSWFLWYLISLSAHSSPSLDQACHRRSISWADLSGGTPDHGYGLWLGSGEYGEWSTISAIVDNSDPAFCQDCYYWSVDRLWWLGRCLWTRHGDWWD